MDDNTTAFLSVLLPILCMVTFFFIGIGLGTQFGFENAYREMKKGTIEQSMKKRFPQVWVELNELNKPGETK